MTDTNAMGTKDGTSVVTPRSALKEAVEQLQNALEASDELGMPQVFCTRETARAILATLSTQTEVMEAMASALEPFAEAAECLDDDHSDGSPIWEASAAMAIDAGNLRRARTALTQYRKTGDL